MFLPTSIHIAIDGILVKVELLSYKNGYTN